MKPKIEWLISGNAPDWDEQNYKDGGFVYDTLVRNILREKYDVKVTYLSRGNSPTKLRRFLEFIKYLRKSRNLVFTGDIVVRDPFSTVFSPFSTSHKNLVIVHHIDTSTFSKNLFYKYWLRQFYKKVLLADLVIVVSKYWQNTFKQIGCKNVKIIYNSFDLELFRFSEQNLNEFRKSLDISPDKPVIYLGNAKPEKGFFEAYNALKNIDATFIATGRTRIDLPIIQKFLSYRDYLKLLSVSTLVLTMSKFNEGWCRTAHEAMLCGTPVIGSGRGGMRELLEEGGQIICDDIHELEPIVRNLLQNKEELCKMASKGRFYATGYNLSYFGHSWLDLIESL